MWRDGQLDAEDAEARVMAAHPIPRELEEKDPDRAGGTGNRTRPARPGGFAEAGTADAFPMARSHWIPHAWGRDAGRIADEGHLASLRAGPAPKSR